jgi:hypothetical protein
MPIRLADWPVAHVRKSEHTVGESVSHAEQNLIAAAACLSPISDFQPLALNGMHLASTVDGQRNQMSFARGCTARGERSLAGCT